MTNQGGRILRNYRCMGSTKFHSFNQRVYKCLTSGKIPESTWAANPTLVQNYLAASEKHDGLYHQATYGSKLDIAERDLLQGQLTIDLDEIALGIEAAALRNPDILLICGFDLAKERRSTRRTKPAIAPEASADQQHGE